MDFLPVTVPLQDVKIENKIQKDLQLYYIKRENYVNND